MKKIIIPFFLSFIFFFAILPRIFFVKADEISDLQKQIGEYEGKISELQKQADSLSQQISLMDNQIKVAGLKITQTEGQIKVLEKEVEQLSGKIILLDGSLNYLSKVLLERIKETYKVNSIDPFTIFLTSNSFSDFIRHYRYLQAVQIHDRELLLSMEQTRTNYDEQKQLKEQKQVDLEKLNVQLESQKKQLSLQVGQRKSLLEETKGKEANYQKLLADSRAELLAISGILAGQGNEVEVRHINEGEKIASVIGGASCNSSGTHLHFMVTQDKNTQNPFNYLKGGIDFENCTTSSCSSGGDSFNPSGNWNWPVDPKITFSQGYGYTWAIQHTWVGRIYKFHNGIDIRGSSLDIKAVKPGTLYRGGFVGKSCTLKYVKVHQDEGNLDTYYLHVNY